MNYPADVKVLSAYLSRALPEVDSGRLEDAAAAALGGLDRFRSARSKRQARRDKKARQAAVQEAERRGEVVDLVEHLRRQRIARIEAPERFTA